MCAEMKQMIQICTHWFTVLLSIIPGSISTRLHDATQPIRTRPVQYPELAHHIYGVVNHQFPSLEYFESIMVAAEIVR